jgi:hypothetical protein
MSLVKTTNHGSELANARVSCYCDLPTRTGTLCTKKKGRSPGATGFLVPGNVVSDQAKPSIGEDREIHLMSPAEGARRRILVWPQASLPVALAGQII